MFIVRNAPRPPQAPEERHETRACPWAVMRNRSIHMPLLRSLAEPWRIASYKHGAPSGAFSRNSFFTLFPFFCRHFSLLPCRVSA
jgi:hypothetical protein